MGKTTEIAWCDASFNTHWGCAKVSPGCNFCYAETWAKRTGYSDIWGVNAHRRVMSDRYWRQPYTWNKKAAGASQRPRVFCNSMSDVFDKNAPLGVRDRLFDLIQATPNLDWLILTKRIGNALGMMPEAWQDGFIPPNVWMGISVVNQEEADRDILKLLKIPAPVRFLSCEPLLAPIDLSGFLWGRTQPCKECPRDIDCECGWKTRKENGEPSLDWIICGGESGAQARPMLEGWAGDIAEQCRHAQVAFFMKQGSQANWPTFKDFASFPLKLQIREWPHHDCL